VGFGLFAASPAVSPSDTGSFDRQTWRKFSQHIVGAEKSASDVRLGSEGDIAGRPHFVRFTPESGHPSAQSKCPLWAKSGRCAASFDHPVGDGE
jgi:hypothetical protein